MNNKTGSRQPAKVTFEVDPVDVPNFSGIPEMTERGWWFGIEEFAAAVVDGSFKDEDGVGYYARTDKISSVKVVLAEFIEDAENAEENAKRKAEGEDPIFTGIRNRMNNGTHVVWLPKGPEDEEETD